MNLSIEILSRRECCASRHSGIINSRFRILSAAPGMIRLENETFRESARIKIFDDFGFAFLIRHAFFILALCTLLRTPITTFKQ